MTSLQVAEEYLRTTCDCYVRTYKVDSHRLKQWPSRKRLYLHVVPNYLLRDAGVSTEVARAFLDQYHQVTLGANIPLQTFSDVFYPENHPTVLSYMAGLRHKAVEDAIVSLAMHDPNHESYNGDPEAIEDDTPLALLYKDVLQTNLAEQVHAEFATSPA